jgi:hypothetical protein
MVASTPHTIILKEAEHVMFKEHVAGGAITPGHLIALNSSGLVVVHPTAGGSAPERLFAFEDDLRGKGIDDAYDSTTNKNVRCGVCQPGVEVYAWLATSQTITIGDLLESNGNGQLKEHLAQQGPQATSPAVGIRTQQVVARALEAVTTTGTAARIKVRVV